jgi:localization factor PodJL
MSESVDKRLRAVEARNDDAAASAVREELSRMASTLEQRFDEIERREAAAFDRMGLEVGRLSERLDERVGAVETRSAQAIEHVGEQVARMAERFNQRHETLSRELGERLVDSEERAGVRVAEAISSIMQRLAEVEEHSQEAIAPVQKAVSSVASKLDRFENERAAPAAHEAAPAPARFDDFSGFGPTLSDPEPAPHVSPRDAAQPVRAAPLKPRTATSEPTTGLSPGEADVYFAEDVIDKDGQGDGFAAAPAFDAFGAIEAPREDDLLIDGASTEATEAPAPALDDDPFWSPADDLDMSERHSEAPTADGDLFGALPEQPAEPDARPDVEPPPGKNDYLARARKAVQAQSLPWTRGSEPSATPHLSLRGSSRVILWTAATAVTALLVGGAWYVKGDAAPRQAAPENLAPTTTPAAAAADANAAFDARRTDPYAQAPIDPSAAASARAGAVVARPLAPRSNASLEQAAQAGDLTAQYELALQRIAAGRTQEGVTLLRRAAERGFPMAQYRLAKLYERGEGVTTDLAVARQWTERAAAAGNRRAMHDLGVYFARGEGAPLDEAAAFRWFRQAAELGVADSQYNLGVLYQQGRGVNTSASEALFWFMVAARQGDHDAGARASALESQLPPIQVQQARARAEAFRPRAASAAANGDFGARPWVARPAT